MTEYTVAWWQALLFAVMWLGFGICVGFCLGSETEKARARKATKVRDQD